MESLYPVIDCIVLISNATLYLFYKSLLPTNPTLRGLLSFNILIILFNITDELVLYGSTSDVFNNNLNCFLYKL